MENTKYQMSFTTGGLFLNESLLVAALYQSAHDWQQTREQALSENILQSRTESSAKRQIREICARLKCLTVNQMNLLLSGSHQEQQYLLWIAVCKHYVFIREFMIEIVREKYLRMDLHLQYWDYDIFFNNKAEWHEELARLSDSTRKKLRQILFKTMREAEIVSSKQMIIPGMLSKPLSQVLSEDNTALLMAFPIPDVDIDLWRT